MTAIGLILMVIGSILMWLFSDPWSTAFSAIEWVAGTCMLSGFIFFTAGVTVWLWRAMP